MVNAVWQWNRDRCPSVRRRRDSVVRNRRMSAGLLARPEMSKTNWPLKNLRGVLLLLIVAFHAFSAYIVTQPNTPPAFDSPPFDWRVFPIIDNERWLGFDLFCAFQFL